MDSYSKHIKIIGMMATYNVVSQGYPFLEAMWSALNVCDAFYILDGNSTDGTKDILTLISKNKKIKIIYEDWPFSQHNTKKGEIIAEVQNKLIKHIVKDLSTAIKKKNTIFF